MSTLKINALQAVAGGATVPIADVINGTARAWVNFNGTGTVAIRASYNVAGITDNGVGDYAPTFTNAFPDANYCAGVLFGDDAGGIMGPATPSGGQTTTSFRYQTKANGGTLTDCPRVHMSFYR